MTRAPHPGRPKFYVGVPEPAWLPRLTVPGFVSASRLARLADTGQGNHIRRTRWALDSGAYTALKAGRDSGHPWWLDRQSYAALVLRLADDIGWPDFCAPQDVPCEPEALAAGFGTVRAHQLETTENFLWLTDADSEYRRLPWIPVLQGWHPHEYLEHFQIYLDCGVDLRRYERVGIGSICRRASAPHIVEVVGELHRLGLRLHAFGVALRALPAIGPLIASADSQAWSLAARNSKTRLPGCTHRGPCSYCLRNAQAYWHRVRAVLDQPARTTA